MNAKRSFPFDLLRLFSCIFTKNKNILEFYSIMKLSQICSLNAFKFIINEQYIVLIRFRPPPHSDKDSAKNLLFRKFKRKAQKNLVKTLLQFG